MWIKKARFQQLIDDNERLQRTADRLQSRIDELYGNAANLILKGYALRGEFMEPFTIDLSKVDSADLTLGDGPSFRLGVRSGMHLLIEDEHDQVVLEGTVQ